MHFGFNQKYATPTQTRAMGVSTLPGYKAPLVKYGGDDPVNPANQPGGGNLPNGCPKGVGWWWIPLGCAGVMQFVSWLLARK